MLVELALLEPDNQCDTFQGTRRIFINEMVLPNMLCNENFIRVKIKLVAFTKYIF